MERLSVICGRSVINLIVPWRPGAKVDGIGTGGGIGVVDGLDEAAGTGCVEIRDDDACRGDAGFQDAPIQSRAFVFRLQYLLVFHR